MRAMKRGSQTADRSFIVLHHHVVFGVDDESKTLNESLELLKMAAKDGVTAVIAKSHAYPAMQEFPAHVYFSSLARLQQSSVRCGIPASQ